jgi:hypothetical protein
VADIDDAEDRANAGPAGAIHALVRDVSGTPQEFDASLRQAAAGGLDGAWPAYRVTDGDVRLHIDAASGPDRCLGSVRLPTLRVTLRFTTGDPVAQQALLARLDRAMHRGGG